MKRALLACVLCVALLFSGCAKQVDPYENVPNPIFTITLEDGSIMRGELYPREAPNTVANFIELANAGFYDNMRFSRVVTGYLVQTGDPLGDGTGGPGYTIAGEFSKNGVQNNLKHIRGTLSMARLSDYNSAGSQFFIVERTISEYDGSYAAFGRITEESGLQALDGIASAATDWNYTPLVDEIIQSIRVDTGGYVYPVVKIEPET